MDKNVRVRFAPSPTGYLHVGGARTALFNYLFAKANGGKFILRIEDTDRTRFQEDSLKEIFESLKWLDLQWDEGPEKGGDYGPYIQSERLDLYKKYALELIENGNAYYCFCTPERLQKVREEKEKNKEKQGGYDRHCRNLRDDEVKSKLESGIPYVIRLKIPLNDTVTFNDAIRGEITYDTNQLDDIVLLKSDGFPTYHLASIVDDRLMKITHVLRGDEWIASAPRHVLLYKALGWEPPVFAHMPVILSPSGGKLSKRKGAASVMDYKKAGYLSEALVNFLALLGWNPGDDREILSREELEKLFSLERVSPKPAVFDEQKLEWLNSQYIMEMSAEKLLEEVRPLFQAEGIEKEDEFLIKLIGLMKQRVRKLPDFVNNTKYFFKEFEEYNAKAVKKRFLKGEPIKVLETAKEIFENTDDFSAENIEKLLTLIAEKLELSPGGVNPVVRLAVTGEGGGPDLKDTIELIGKETTIKRIDKAINWIKNRG